MDEAIPVTYKEKTFTYYLARELERKYGCECWLHEKGHRQFHISKVKQYPDLYVKTKIKGFPVIVIETKLGKKLNQITRGFWQIEKYIKGLINAKYTIDKKEVEKPKIILIATPTSYSDGILYYWKAPMFRNVREASKGISEALNRLFWQINSAILKGGFFQYKNQNYWLK